ncbi:MAG TPA: alpha/beta hydrolase [Vicinamibacterales bacterium]|nr:alpha/beta hydrolase [Vicinamibacterales bacterium]
MLTLTAAALLFLAIWIVVPAPVVWVLPLGVLAPEVSPILLGLSGIVLLLSLRRLGTRKMAVVLALAATAISAIPISKLSAVEREFDAAFARAFPEAARTPPTPDARARPVVWRDLLLGIQTGDVRVHRALRYAAPDGRSLALDVYRPAAPGTYPILVQIYGGAWQWGNRTDNETFARYFASRGYVVMAVEYRHAPAAPWPAALADVRAALAFTATNAASYEGDPSRIAVIGRSSGAQLALLAAYAGESRVRAAVSYYGPSDLATAWHEPPQPDPVSVRSVLEVFLGGTPETVPDRYRAASPITYASGSVPPTLLIHGGRDHVVPPAFARSLQTQLRASGARSLLLEIPWAEHAFDFLPNGLSAQIALYYTERFLAAQLAR